MKIYLKDEDIDEQTESNIIFQWLTLAFLIAARRRNLGVRIGSEILSRG
jgi:hypothetical protein